MTRRILTREEVRELDRLAIEEVGVPSLLLMENAGRACADEVERLLDGRSGRVVCVCGPGNNGGDGLVIARTLWNRGHEAQVVFVGERDALENAGEDVRVNARLWRALGQEVAFVGEGLAGLDLAHADVVVDALFGTGLTRKLEGVWAEVVHAINASGHPVVAVDVPSGLDADTGEVLGECVVARCTVSFVAAKKGFFEGEGPRVCGEVRVAEIGIPRFLLEE